MSQLDDYLAKFKAFVAAIESTGDTVALDKALGEANNLLHNVRIVIDYEWAAARATHKGRRVLTTFKSCPNPFVTLSDLGLTTKEKE